MADLAPDAAHLCVWAESRLEAWGRIVRARTEAPLEESEQLAAAFDAPAPSEFAIGGPHAELTERVVLDALALTRAADLAGRRLVLVSPAPPTPELRAAVVQRGASWVHAPWSAPEE